MTLQWITTQQAAERWGVSPRHVQRLISAGRVSGVKKYGRSWMIPSASPKPGDPLLKPFTAEFSILPYFSSAADRPCPKKDQAALHNQYRAEIAYMRGDFDQSKHYAAAALKSKSTWICAAFFTLLAAISTNDFELYCQTEASLKRRAANADDPRRAIQAEIVLNTAAVSLFAPEMASGWMQEGVFSHLPPESLPFALYLRVKYLQSLADYPQMAAVAQTAFTLCRGKNLAMDIHLLLMSAIANVMLGRQPQARGQVLEALALGMPHGFITPFVQHLVPLAGLVEECINERYAYAYDTLLSQWDSTLKNWVQFHNRFAHDHVTLLLKPRELRIAVLAASRISYRKIAEQEYLSVGRVRNILQEVYGKLFVRNRKELADLVLWTLKKK